MSHDRLPQRPARAALAGIALALLSIASPGGALAVDTRAEAREARRKAAATSLFAQALRDQAENLGTPVPECGLADNWSAYPIPADVARRHLGLRIAADLLAPPIVEKPSDVRLSWIDRKAYCTDDEFKAFQDRSQIAFRALADDKPDGSMRLFRRSFGFPVFNADYSRAVLFASGDEKFWFRRSGRESRSVHGVGNVRVYERRAGRWRLRTVEPLFHYS